MMARSRLRRRSMGNSKAVKKLVRLLSGKRPLGVRQLPKTGQQPAGGPSAQIQAPFSSEQKYGDLLHPPRSFCRLDRKRRRGAGSEPLAKPGKRTKQAERRAVWQAGYGSQLHQRLVEISHPCFGQHSRHQCGQLPFDGGQGHIRLAGKQARNHPQNVSIDGGNPQPEGDRTDRTGGVLPDARQLPQRGKVGGQPAAEPLHYDLRGMLEVAGAAVVAQALPEL